MPRIRKQTSNRVKTHDREKIKKKVRESRRKKAKLAKKNPQWKSKKPKDPGIPSDFPYKDQILAEVQEQRRVAAEEKQRKKEEKTKAIAKAKAFALGQTLEDVSENEMEAGDTSEDEEKKEGQSSFTKSNLNVGADSIASLSAKTLNTILKPRPQTKASSPELKEDEDVPVLINRDLPNLDIVLDKADVILEVLDARDPLSFYSKHIEDLAKEKGKKLLLVLNKIDRCPRESLVAWGSHLRKQHPTYLFRSATAYLPEEQVPQAPSLGKSSKGKAKIPLNDAVGAASITSCLAQWAKELPDNKDLNVAVVGMVNVGKSSVINSLLQKSVFVTYSLGSASQSASTTELPQGVTLEVDDGRKIALIDTPGFSFVAKADDGDLTSSPTRVHDILLRSRGRIDRLKDPIPPISEIVTRASNEDLLLLYSLPAFPKGDPSAFLSGVARAHQLVKKKGELDLMGAARIVLRDWNTGKFAHYTTPVGTQLGEPSSEDASILESHPTRRDMRRTGGLVKMTPSAAEERLIDLERNWVVDNETEEDDSDNSASDMTDDGIDEDNSGDDEEGTSNDMDEEQDEEDENDDGIPEVMPMSQKQKRKRDGESVVPPPPKKVSLGHATAFRAKSGQSSSKVLQPETQSKRSSGPKSILKKTSGLASGRLKKPANAKIGTVKETLLGAANSSNGPEVYDFGKFF